jgi:hypothetical protein
MDVAQALQEAQAATTEAEITTQSPIPYSAARQVEPPAPAIDKRKSGFDQQLGHVIPSLAEEGTRQRMKPELDIQKDVEISQDVRGQEKTCPDDLSPVQQDTHLIEIREWQNRLCG